MITRRYSELRRLETFEERYDYLKLQGHVGKTTFGFDRWLNQEFYRSAEWRRARRDAIVRDNGCDLGIEGHDIFAGILIHHLNPLDAAQIEAGSDELTNLDNLITTNLRTHNAIHFGDASLLAKPYAERKPGDTLLWG